jgi:hypothetical protein
VVSSGYGYVSVRVSIRDHILSDCHTLEVSSDYYDIPVLIPVLVTVSVLDRCLYGCHRVEEA